MEKRLQEMEKEIQRLKKSTLYYKVCYVVIAIIFIVSTHNYRVAYNRIQNCYLDVLRTTQEIVLILQEIYHDNQLSLPEKKLPIQCDSQVIQEVICITK